MLDYLGSLETANSNSGHVCRIDSSSVSQLNKYPSPEDGTLEYWTMDKVQKACNSMEKNE
jgi:hypothetical protein